MPNTWSAEFESAVEMVRTMLRHVLGGHMAPVELAAWLRRTMTNDQHPMSDNEKSAITCALVLMLLGDDIELASDRKRRRSLAGSRSDRQADLISAAVLAWRRLSAPTRDGTAPAIREPWAGASTAPAR
ncbi:hypothetical protein QFZ27_001528 [Inquilinus ginsengisoli]|uniref:hypothetical protein n=1 Tax=Inquilinus ginsengisoli TaxID=363840 RepID=UPI003D1F17C4